MAAGVAVTVWLEAGWGSEFEPQPHEGHGQPPPSPEMGEIWGRYGGGIVEV